LAPAVAELAIVVLGFAAPEVKGALLIDEAPEKATEVVDGLGVREVALGFRTLRASSTSSFRARNREHNIPINDVHNTVVDKNVWKYDLCGIDENVAIFDSDGNVSTIDCLKRSIAKNTTIADSASHDVIFKDGC
jgi:hypothetical protein